MTLGQFIEEVCVQGKVAVSIWEDGDEVVRANYESFDGLGLYMEDPDSGFSLVDFEDCEITYIYPNPIGLVIEVAAPEKE